MQSREGDKTARRIMELREKIAYTRARQQDILDQYEIMKKELKAKGHVSTVSAEKEISRMDKEMANAFKIINKELSKIEARLDGAEDADLN